MSPARFERIPGPSRRMRDTRTGETLSYRQYRQRYQLAGATLEKARKARRAAGKPTPHKQSLHAAAQVAAIMRKDPSISLSAAARQAHTTTTSAKRHLGKSVRTGKHGRLRVAPTDRMRVPMYPLTVRGYEEVITRGSRERALLGAHEDAIDTYLLRRDESGLIRLRGRRVRVGSELVELETDPVEIDRLDAGGALDDGSRYRPRGGGR